jgi:hypothetical protein
MMAAAVGTEPVTARIFLFGAGPASAHDLAHALDEQGVSGALVSELGFLSQSGQIAVTDAAARVAAEMLDVDLGDILIAAWRQMPDLRAAAGRTVTAPGSSEVVELATHRVTSTHSPSADVLVNDTRVRTVHFELRIEFLVKGFVGTVRGGRLVSIYPGRCDVTATLTAEGHQVATQEGQLDLRSVIRLDDGILLLPVPGTARTPGE